VNGLRLLQILVAVLGVSCGQVLLKLAAARVQASTADTPSLQSFLLNGYLLAGVCVLGLATLLWTWTLRWVPLSQAYPFMALAFVMVPLIWWFLGGETMSARQLAGTVLIVAGVVVVSI
jgi:drug/metabolite transporter (DMT)-like permease